MLIFEKYLTEADNTGDWYTPEERTIEIIDGEALRGRKNILITFTNNGMGNFYDFYFNKIVPLSLTNAGETVYNEFVPFMTSDIKIGYRCENDTLLKITLNDEEYHTTAKKDENFFEIELKGALLPGVHELKIESYDYIYINSIVFNKMKTDTAQVRVHSDYKDTPYIEYTDFEQAMRSAIMDVKYSDLIKIQDEFAVRILSTFTKVKAGTKIAEPVARICSEGENIVVSIIKKPESDEDGAIVVRVFNASDKNTNGVISLCSKILKAEKVNLNEEKEYEMPVNNGKLEYELMP